MENIGHKRIVQEYYSKRARDYDRQKIRTWKSEQGLGAEVLNEVVDALVTFEDKCVLEVGVGSGRVGFPLLKKVRLYFVGFDLSREMLRLAKAKISVCNQKCDLVLGDAEHLPFSDKVFDAIICISTMHYFSDFGRTLIEFSHMLKEKGVFVYGDLTLHELDDRGFLDALEKMLSQAHVIYFKSSKVKRILEDYGFSVNKMKVIPYRKSYLSLMEDKGKYFNVKFDALNDFIRRATPNERELYSIASDELTLFYTLITTVKERKT